MMLGTMFEESGVRGACHFCRSGQMHKCEIRNVDTAKALSIMVFESMSINTHRKSDTLPVFGRIPLFLLA
jgi:hypothetical protein